MNNDGHPPRCWDYLHEVTAKDDTPLNEPQRQDVNAVIVQAGSERIGLGVGDPLKFSLRQFLKEFQRQRDESWREGQANHTLSTYYRLDEVDFPLAVRTVAVILKVERQEARRLMAELIDAGELVRTRVGCPKALPGFPDRKYWQYLPGRRPE
jgi:hypothetical protein